MDLGETFTKISERMKLDFEEAQEALAHPGQKGAANEDVMRTFLRKYLLSTIGITEGAIIDSYRGRSRQLDVIRFDEHRTPVFFESAQTREIPVECVYAVIEVKARLDKNEFDAVIANMESVESLRKESYSHMGGGIEWRQNLYGSAWKTWPTNYFTFAFTSSEKGALHKCILSHPVNANPVHKRVDTICVLNSFVLCNGDGAGTVHALPTHATQFVRVDNDRRALLLFYGLLSSLMNQASMPSLNLNPYINKFIV